jgi:hypothetical protein
MVPLLVVMVMRRFSACLRAKLPSTMSFCLLTSFPTLHTAHKRASAYVRATCVGAVFVRVGVWGRSACVRAHACA